jgi:hypothetical protein
MPLLSGFYNAMGMRSIFHRKQFAVALRRFIWVRASSPAGSPARISRLLKEYSHLLRDDPTYAEKARGFAAKVQDISEFLADHLHEPPTGRIEARVTYADSCHLRHGQRVVAQPRRLLRQIPGLTLVELRQPDRCCGSAGVYNILHPETAEPILAAKTADIRDRRSNCDHHQPRLPDATALWLKKGRPKDQGCSPGRTAGSCLPLKFIRIIL